MARDESNREDLLREATALVERIELLPKPHVDAPVERHSAHVVAGFRANGAFSIYFGDDAVYQFNAAGELRRAFCEGRLFKASGGSLVAVRRVRTTDEVQLLATELSEPENAAFLRQVSDRLNELSTMLNEGSFQIIGQVPGNADLITKVRTWLAEHPSATVAARPNV